MCDVDRDAGIALACVRGIGPAAFRAARARDGGVSEALGRLSQVQLAEARRRAAEITTTTRGAGAQLLLQGESSYPAALLDLADPPPLLFASGDLSLLSAPAVALVGTRAASPYGDRTARRLASDLALHGVTVVSGMARGIDAAAHEGALAARGGTVAVVAGGVDQPYPPRHRALHQRLQAEGLVLSEAPCGRPPHRGAFPRRNRIIAALSRATVVIEAGARSGALLTATFALEIGRAVGAVPGPVDSATSDGTNALIRDGAAPVVGVADILHLAGMDSRRRREAADEPTIGTTATTPAASDPLTQAVWTRLRVSSASLDTLVAETGSSPRDVLRSLTALEIAGLVCTDASRYVAS